MTEKSIHYLTIDQMVEKLKEDGLIISSKKELVSGLNRIGYYKLINAYKKPFKATENGIKKYVNGATSAQLLFLAKFDYELRNLLFHYIAKIELCVKNLIANVMTKNYGPTLNNVLVERNFKEDDALNPRCRTNFNKLKKFINREIKKNIEKENSYIMHYYNNYNKIYPFWVAINVLSFGDIGIFYKKMKVNDQQEVADFFGTTSSYLESFLSVLCLFRNACAHNECIYYLHTHNRIKVADYKGIFNHYEIPEYRPNKFSKGMNDVFCNIVCFKILLEKKDFKEFMEKFCSLLNKLKKVMDEDRFKFILSSMGILNYEKTKDIINLKGEEYGLKG